MPISNTRLIQLKERLNTDDETTIKRTLQELTSVAMTVDMLKDTGIGIAVNKLRRHESLGGLARQLVSTWKERAAAETSKTDESSESTPTKKQKLSLDDYRSKKPTNHDVLSDAKLSEVGKFTADAKPNRDSASQKPSKKSKSKSDKKDGLPSSSGYDKAALPGSSSLQVDWSKVLPQKLTTDYRPQAHHRLEFANSSDDDERRQRKNCSSADAVDFMQLKNRKMTKIYSGRRNIYLQTVPSLFESCIHVLCDNIDALGYTGGVPYDILKPVMERATPTQLFRIEELNPYLLQDTSLLWENHCKRDFKGVGLDWEEGETWRELYERQLKEREEKLSQLTKTIAQQKAAKETCIRQAKLATAKAPRDVRRRQIKYGTYGKEAASAEEVAQSRRNLDLHPNDKTKILKRPVSGIYEEEQRHQTASRARKPTVAPLMAKTLKMLKQTRSSRI